MNNPVLRKTQRRIESRRNQFLPLSTMIIEVEAGKEFSLLGSDRKDHDHKKDFRTLKKIFPIGTRTRTIETFPPLHPRLHLLFLHPHIHLLLTFFTMTWIRN